MRERISGKVAAKLAVKDDKIGTYVDVPGTQLTSYADIQIGETYHVIVPAGNAFETEEFIYGTLSNVRGLVVSREDGMDRVGLGYNGGYKTFNLTLNRTSGITQYEPFECDITVSQVHSDTGGAPFQHNLYQFMYTQTQRVFKPFALED